MRDAWRGDFSCSKLGYQTPLTKKLVDRQTPLYRGSELRILLRKLYTDPQNSVWEITVIAHHLDILIATP